MKVKHQWDEMSDQGPTELDRQVARHQKSAEHDNQTANEVKCLGQTTGHVNTEKR